MNVPEDDKRFSGSIAQLYEQYLVPMIFEPYAADLAHRVAARPVTRVLEIAAGTSVLTRALSSVLPETVTTSIRPSRETSPRAGSMPRLRSAR